MVKIGYVGLGAMGGSLARHLIGKHELRVLDRNPAAIDKLRQAGAQSSADGAELARDCDLIFLCLPR
jgi:3-hydroxyisobutyrate dehydrogenase